MAIIVFCVCVTELMGMQAGENLSRGESFVSRACVCVAGGGGGVYVCGRGGGGGVRESVCVCVFDHG